MTLTEILVVIVIVSLIAVTVIALIRPNDDRRVQREAERLASYLLGASAEAQMSDGPIRVAFDFSGSAYTREKGAVGADITTPTWARDKRAKPDKVKAPVTLAAVTLPLVGELTSGEAWMVWDGVKAAGGVALLKLNDAEWSVVVEPRSGDVKVIRGRVPIPDRPQIAVRRNLLPPLGALSDPAGLGELPDGGLAAIDPSALNGLGLNDPHILDPNNSRSRDAGFDRQFDAGLNDLDAGVGYDAGLDQQDEDRLADLGFDEADFGGAPDAGWGECGNPLNGRPPNQESGDQECAASHPGQSWWRCNLESRECYPSSVGHGISTNRINFEQPARASSFLNTLTGLLSAEGQFNFVATVSGESCRSVSCQQSGQGQVSAYIFQADPDGGRGFVVPDPRLPAFSLRGSLQPSSSSPNSGVFSYRFSPLPVGNNRGETPSIDFWVYQSSGSRCWSRISIPADSVTVEVTIDLANQGQNRLAFTGVIGSLAAERVPIPRFLTQSLGITGADNLAELLTGPLNTPPSIGYERDGNDDAWPLKMSGQAETTRVGGNPQFQVGRFPSPACDE